jgi:hypothetical protein
MKKAFLVLFAFSFLTVNAQDSKPTYKIVGNEIVKIDEVKKETSPPKETEFTHTINGIKYKVYQSPGGSYFIKRISKTGKEYKQYLKIN